MRIGITWHREEKLYNIKRVKQKLFSFLNWLDRTELSFNIWWATWIDTYVWLWCIENRIPYNLYLPYFNIGKQINWWNKEQKLTFHLLYQRANKIYIWNWYFSRNRLLVDNSDYLVSYLTDSKSGTGYTVNYAIKKWKIVKALKN